MRICIWKNSIKKLSNYICNHDKGFLIIDNYTPLLQDIFHLE